MDRFSNCYYSWPVHCIHHSTPRSGALSLCVCVCTCVCVCVCVCVCAHTVSLCELELRLRMLCQELAES